MVRSPKIRDLQHWGRILCSTISLTSMVPRFVQKLLLTAEKDKNRCKRYEKKKKFWIWQKRYFDQHLGAVCTWKLVKIHYSYTFFWSGRISYFEKLIYTKPITFYLYPRVKIFKGQSVCWLKVYYLGFVLKRTLDGLSNGQREISKQGEEDGTACTGVRQRQARLFW